MTSARKKHHLILGNHGGGPAILTTGLLVVLWVYVYSFASNPNPFIVWPLLGGILLGVGLMVASAVMTPVATKRWLIFSLVGLLVVAFGVLTIYSVGLLLAPLGLALFAVSVIKLLVIGLFKPNAGQTG